MRWTGCCRQALRTRRRWLPACPCTRAITATTEATPMAMPRAVSTLRRPCAPMACHAARRLSVTGSTKAPPVVSAVAGNGNLAGFGGVSLRRSALRHVGNRSGRLCATSPANLITCRLPRTGANHEIRSFLRAGSCREASGRSAVGAGRREAHLPRDARSGGAGGQSRLRLRLRGGASLPRRVLPLFSAGDGDGGPLPAHQDDSIGARHRADAAGLQPPRPGSGTHRGTRHPLEWTGGVRFRGRAPRKWNFAASASSAA